MATTGLQVITTVRSILLDPDADWFSNATLLDFINTAQARVVMARPELTAAVATLTLVSGSVQQLPATALALLDIYHNVDSKTAATETPRSVLDNGFPSWPNATPNVDVIHWVYDPRHKTVYRVYPPNNGSGQVVALVSNLPALLAATSETLSVADVYKPAVDALTLAEAYGANSVKRDVEKANYYENKAMTMLGVNAQAGIALAPKFSAPGGA